MEVVEENKVKIYMYMSCDVLPDSISKRKKILREMCIHWTF